MTEYYRTDPDDPDAPVKLAAFMDMAPGDRVDYVGALPLGRPGETFVLDALYAFGREGPTPGACGVLAILNDGEYEVNAENICPATS